MAEIDKIIAKQPAPVAGKPVPVAGRPVTVAGGAPASGPPARQGTAPLPAARGRAALTGWVRVLLGVAVAIGVAQWPYAHACGLALDGYLAAAGGVVLAGLWGAVTSWRRRMAMAHVLSVVVTLWGGVLVGKAVLDRSNYVRHPATWACR
jgi:hypothetical protein